MERVADDLSVGELLAGYRGRKDVVLARRLQVVWLLAQGRTVAEGDPGHEARLTGFVRRRVEELVVRHDRFGPSSLGDRRRGNGAGATAPGQRI